MKPNQIDRKLYNGGNDNVDWFLKTHTPPGWDGCKRGAQCRHFTHACTNETDFHSAPQGSHGAECLERRYKESKQCGDSDLLIERRKEGAASACKSVVAVMK
jgi:hypothetical protein